MGYGILNRAHLFPNHHMKLLFALFFVSAACYCCFQSVSSNESRFPNVTHTNSRAEKPSTDRSVEQLKPRAAQLREFAMANDYNTDIFFMIDMQVPSGKKRFFIYNMAKDTIEQIGLVTHGQGNAADRTIQFSNEPGSNCSSPGKYRIGAPYTGKFGLAFKLHGLDQGNSNAFKRFVVLHAHSCVPDEEVDPDGICRSQGCPTVSPAFLQELTGYIVNSKKPILLNIYP
ncbi:MAG: hypothetical protein JWQ27_1254 [Ferruginibacter sp.]|nr:hypothetical protein [Ferruginibacter sp.]